MIEAVNLCKYYQGRKAINNVSFHIKEGEIVGLLGLNGAGKSTILKILGCFLTPSKGTAFINNYDIEKDAHKIREIVGYLPDVPPLYNEMFVKSYLEFVAALKGIKRSLIKDKVNRVIQIAQLEEVKNLRISELSYGYRQRVSIAQAIVHEPKVLILDEPISGLDPMQIVEMRDLILSLKGLYTVILSSHILSEVTKTCDRILIVHNGEIVAEGSEKDLQEKISQKMLLKVEITQIDDALVDVIKNISGVENVEVKNDTNTLVIKTVKDCRAQISKAIVQHNANLLSFYREDNVLENLFINFVKN